MASAPSKRSSHKVWLGLLIGVVLTLAGVTVASAVVTVVHPPADHDHTYSAFGCDFKIKFNGTDREDQSTADPSDDLYTWKYKVTELNGDPGCGLSHWVLELCKPEAFNAYDSSGSDPPFLTFPVDPDPGNTGLSGVKWNDIPDSFVMGDFFVVLNVNLPVDHVPVAFKTGAGVVTGTIEGPSCEIVGGIVQLRAGSSDSPARPADSSGSSADLYVILAGASAAVLTLAAGAWSARRRWLR